MILQQLHIDGFGKLTNLDLTFSDNINLIYGNNEAGKSTLCSFIFHMLFGLERGRGRASRFDAYIRFLPWNAAAYGGSLTFAADGSTWFLERNFLADTRFIRLTRLDDGMIFPDPESTLTQLLSHVSESSYRALFHLSGQSISDISGLSDILRRYTQNLAGTGSMNFSATQAIQTLKRQKRETTQKISPVASGDLLRINEDLDELEFQLDQLHQAPIYDPANSEVNDSSPRSGTISKTRYRSGFILLPVGILFLIAGIIQIAVPPLWLIDSLSVSPLLPAAFCFAVGLILILIRSSLISEDAVSIETSELHRYVELKTLLDRKELLNERKTVLEKQLSANHALRQEILSLELAIDTIASLSSDIHHTYSPDLQRLFLRHARALTGRPFAQLYIDESFRFSLLEEGHTIPLEALSRGTITQLLFACRLATIDLLYPDAFLPLLLDDVFSTTDDTRLSVLLARLNADYPGQKLFFTCQKREAVILSQHSLSYHLIQL